MNVAFATPGSAADYRLLYVSVAGSMLLHLGLVIGVQRAPPREPPPRITATLREIAPPAPALQAAALTPPAPEPAPQQPVAAPPVPPPPKPEPRAQTPPDPKKVAPKAEERPAEPRLVAPSTPTAPAPSVATPVAPVEAKPEAKPEAKAEARVERDAPRPAAAPAPAPAPGEPSERELVGRYQQQLADIIETRKLKRYPNDAMQNNWEGTATVLLKIGTDTKIAGVEIAVSSGHEILDEQARISISRAKPFVQVPEGLKGKMFEARVRVVFSLKN